MNPAIAASRAALLLWTCVLLFAARVIGQLEVMLLAPDWLPPMDAWYSGLLPYPLLLPIQIGILMVMAVVAWNPRVRRGLFARRHPRMAQALRLLALVYFLVMAVRLAVNVHANRADFWSAGAIPVAFHWVLALFMSVSGRAPVQPGVQDDDDIPHGDVPTLAQPLACGSGFGRHRRDARASAALLTTPPDAPTFLRVHARQ